MVKHTTDREKHRWLKKKRKIKGKRKWQCDHRRAAADLAAMVTTDVHRGRPQAGTLLRGEDYASLPGPLTGEALFRAQSGVSQSTEPSFSFAPYTFPGGPNMREEPMAGGAPSLGPWPCLQSSHLTGGQWGGVQCLSFLGLLPKSSTQASRPPHPLNGHHLLLRRACGAV